jgi:hypothetical protein
MLRAAIQFREFGIGTSGTLGCTFANGSAQ